MADARGSGASFGTRTGELSQREISDYGELIGWIAAQPWSNGRIGVYGGSYEGQAAELIAGKHGVAGALDRLAAVTGQPAETIALPPPVKPVDGPDGPALLGAAIGEHQSNADVHALTGRNAAVVPGTDGSGFRPGAGGGPGRDRDPPRGRHGLHRGREQVAGHRSPVPAATSAT